MRACSRRTFDSPINIPAIQATVLKKGVAAGLNTFQPDRRNGKSVGVIGGGPSGLAAASVLAQLGYKITLYEARKKLGGMLRLIPGFRLDAEVWHSDIAFVKRLGAITVKLDTPVRDAKSLLRQHDAVIVCAGLEEPIRLNIPGEEYAISWQHFLEGRVDVKGRRVAVIGGGAVAADCATTAKRAGALAVEMIYRRKLEHMPLTRYERDLLLEHGIEILTCAKPLALIHEGKRIEGLQLAHLNLPAGKTARPGNFVVSRKEPPFFREVQVVIVAIGSRPQIPVRRTPGLFYAGDILQNSGTVVEVVASGKNAALEADAFLRQAAKPRIPSRIKSFVTLAGTPRRPVPLDARFFGRSILSPFLLSAAPHSDGYLQLKQAYERGWAGAVMKTAFDNVPIHIPSEYMFALTRSTYGNCDNVSGHKLDRVCREVERLVKEFPLHLTLASTGGPVTGRDAKDRRVWQSNTRKLEIAGAMGVEYSLSCPQGGDGTHGDVVSQNAELTQKVINWVMETGAPNVPKLFKLTGAVTAIQPIIRAIREVLARYPNKQAGITLANSFPSLAFRKATAKARAWDEGIVIGMSGEGVLPISNLTLAKVAGSGVIVSGNGGPMSYLDAANFLALGAETVQFCTIVMKYGLGIIDDLHLGLSYLMQARGFRSVSELIGSALPQPITGFEALTAVKKLPRVKAQLCEHCGNCARCPYLAIALDKRGVPNFDPSRCVGCSLCAQKCFAGAIAMRPRTKKELALLEEG